METMEVNGD